MQLRYLEDVEIEKATRTKQANGTVVLSYTRVADYKVQLQELTDEVSASIYGANVNRMYRISSPQHDLEAFLSSKANNTSDNISLYFVRLNGAHYKIMALKKNWVDISL